MNDRRHLTGPHDTASLLAAAEQQRQLRSGNSLVTCLLDEISASLSAAFVHVWEIVESNEPKLLWKRGDSEAVPERAKQAVFGQVKQLSKIPVSSETPQASIYAALCEVGDGLRIVLELAVPDQYFDRQQILELVELLADLHRRSMVSVLLRNSRRVGELQQIVSLLHSDLDPVRVATSLASDAADFLKCHRISVARRISRSRWELVTATAVSQPDPRSDSSRRLCGLIEDASHSEVSGTTNSAGKRRRVPHTQEQFHDSDSAAEAESGLPDYSVRPLSISGHWDDAEWAALFEWPSDTDEERKTDAYLIEICRHAALAFRNCQDYFNAGMLSTLRRLPQTFRSRRILIAIGLMAALTAGLMFFKIDLRIEVMGKLVPSERVFIFAPEDGVITEIFVEDGTSVAVNGQLCTLRNEDLEIQLEGIDGEVAAAQARLAALESLRGDRSLSQSGMFSVEQAELKERLIALEAQSVILSRRITKLAVNAIIAGQIYGDRLQELLKGRPVQRGQYLFELANPDAGWQLDMRIPEVDVRHVIQEQAKSGTELLVSFAVETAPEKEFTTTLTRLSASTDVDEFGRLSVLATATPGNADILNPRPGAGVVGHIHCGSRSAGYVLFRRIIESFQRRWWK